MVWGIVKEFVNERVIKNVSRMKRLEWKIEMAQQLDRDGHRDASKKEEWPAENVPCTSRRLIAGDRVITTMITKPAV
jgi:hypothetical protein